MSATHPSASPGSDARPPDGGIAIVVLTHGRVHLLRQCVENVLARASAATQEIVIWDNGSADGTADYLRSLDDPRIRVVISPENVGFNAYPRAFGDTSAPYMVQLDDDVTDAPQDWDLMLRDAFVQLPDVGFLAADLEDDPHDVTSRYRHHIRPHEYTEIHENGIRLLLGPAGSTCAMTSRELNRRVGGYSEREGEVFWLEDTAYVQDMEGIGFRAVVLADLQVRHTGGPHYSTEPAEKIEFWERYWAERKRREAVKGALCRIPGVRRLNARFGWFVAPERGRA